MNGNLIPSMFTPIELQLNPRNAGSNTERDVTANRPKLFATLIESFVFWDWDSLVLSMIHVNSRRWTYSYTLQESQSVADQSFKGCSVKCFKGILKAVTMKTHSKWNTIETQAAISSWRRWKWPLTVLFMKLWWRRTR